MLRVGVELGYPRVGVFCLSGRPDPGSSLLRVGFMTADDFLVSTHAHIHENVKFADAKAIAFIAINSGVVASLFSNKMLFLRGQPVAMVLLSSAAFGLLAAGVVLSTLVIWPRGLDVETGIDGGKLTMPSKIAAHLGVQDYADAVRNAAPNDLTNDLAALVLARARINQRKFLLLRWAIIISLVGLLVAGAFVAVTALAANQASV
jgi:Family of unknown function (DUF5706)